jgi:hypothetical protein
MVMSQAQQFQLSSLPLAVNLVLSDQAPTVPRQGALVQIAWNLLRAFVAINSPNRSNPIIVGQAIPPRSDISRPITESRT